MQCMDFCVLQHISSFALNKNFMWKPLSKYSNLFLLYLPHLPFPHSFTENSDSFSDVSFALVRCCLLSRCFVLVDVY